MRAAVVPEFGTPDVITVGDVDEPKLQPGEILVRVAVAGINFADAGMVSGASRRAEPPFVPGVEAAGTVLDAGDGGEFSVGDRVVYWNPLPSAFAEQAAVSAWRAVKLPDDVTDDVAVSLMVAGTTAHYLAVSTAPLEAGQSCLIWAAAGGVGHLLVQIAKLRGARPIAIVGSDEKAEIALALGADVAIRYRQEDVVVAVHAATDGQGVDAASDSVGAATIERSLQSTKRLGMCVLYGGSSGAVRALDTTLMQAAGSIFFTRPGLGDYLRNGTEYQSRLADLFEWHQQGELTPRIGDDVGFDGVADALTRMAAGTTSGKLLVRP